jgi:hypothetical protein
VLNLNIGYDNKTTEIVGTAIFLGLQIDKLRKAYCLHYP